MSQTSYSINQGVARAGLLADIADNDVISRLADAAIPFGTFVAQGANVDDSVKSPAASTDITVYSNAMGVALHTHAIESISGGNADGQYALKDAVSVLRQGRVYVKVEQAVTPDSDVFVRFAAGAGGTVLGAFRADADTATAAQAPNMRYMNTAASGGFAVLEVRLS